MATEQEKQFFQKNFTLQGRIFYPNILKPEPNDSGKLRFSCLFAFKIGSNQNVVNEIQQMLAQAKQMFHPSIPDMYFVNPLKQWGVYQRQDGKPVHEFLRDCFWINASSGAEYPPPVVKQGAMAGTTVQLVHGQDDHEVYSGRNAVVNISFWNLNTPTKKGVSSNLNAVMLMEGGEREGGYSVNPNQIFGNFLNDMGQAASAPNSFGQQVQQPAQQVQQPAQQVQQVQQPAWNPQQPAQQVQQPAQQQPAQQQPAQQQPAQQWPPLNGNGNGFI